MKGNQRLVFAESDEKEKVEQKEIIRAKMVKIEDKQVPCKKCGQNPRKLASKHCNECSHGHKMQIINDGRLQEKINKQIFKK